MKHERSALPSDSTTLELALADASEALELLEHWADHLDSKIASAFGTGSLIATLVPALQGVPSSVLGYGLLCLALGGWAVHAFAALSALLPVPWNVARPEILADPRWTSLTPGNYREHRLEHLVEQYRVNLAGYRAKRLRFQVVLLALAIEASALTLLTFVR